MHNARLMTMVALVATVALGSIGALAYLVHRGIKAHSPSPQAARA